VKLETIVCGRIYTNSYILYDDFNRCFIIDPASGKPILDYINENSLKIQAILLTHGHYDHIDGIPDILNSFKDIPIYIDEDDKNCLFDPLWNGSFDTDALVIIANANKVLNYEKDLKFDNASFKVFKFPGHTPGSVVLQYEKMLFTGDFIFRGSVGRTNYYRGSSRSMMESLNKFIEIFGNINYDFKIYPGHMESTTLSYELLHNPFLVRIINSNK
jgi:glyoxylase-like metal-dependent hydrolase (beta-lactamase superfamily II)